MLCYHVGACSQDHSEEAAQVMAGQTKFGSYPSYGVTVSADNQILYYKNQRVKLFADELPDGSFESLWYDEAGTVGLSAIRDSEGRLTGVKGISEETAEGYLKRLPLPYHGSA